MTSVTSLSETPFLTRDLPERLKVWEEGRPQPFLKIGSLEISGENTVVHCFNREIYKRNDWVCGCPIKNALFCFPCLLYGGKDQWTTTGFNDLVHLTNAMKKHEINQFHMSSMLQYANFINDQTINHAEITKGPNERIQKNLHIMNSIIDTIKFCAFNSMPIHRFEQEEDSFQEILMLTNPSDASLINYLQHEPFNSMETLKTDILKAASEVVREAILEEVADAEFVSLIVEAGDAHYPKIIILRYFKGCNIIERVWKIFNRDDMKIFVDKLVADLRSIIKEPTALISQSFDQLSLRKQETTNKLCNKIQIKFPQAFLVHFYGHDVFDVIHSGDVMQKYFPMFSSMVWSLCKLMTDSPYSETMIALFEESRFALYESSTRPYNFEKNKIESIYLNREALLQTMRTIARNSKNYSDFMVSSAEHFVRSLQDNTCINMLECLYKMMPHFKKFISDYQNCEESSWNPDVNTIKFILDGDVPTCQDMLPRNTSEIQVKQEDDLDIQIIDISNIKTEIEEVQFQLTPSTSKRKRQEECDKEEGEVVPVDMIQGVISHLQVLLKYRTNMFVSQLVDPRNFSKFSCAFPDHFLTAATSNLNYFSAFNILTLQNELKVLYDQQDFRSLSSSCDVLKKIMDNKLTSTFPETTKLLKIAITFPSLVDDPKRCFNTKSKVQKFLSAHEGHRNIDCLVYFVCERELVENIKDFNKRIMKRLMESPDRAIHLCEVDN